MTLLHVRLLAATTTTLSIITLDCDAQLFPWSNLKHYFDQKTRNGPGNGGLLQIPDDLSADGNSHQPSSVGIETIDATRTDSTTASTITKQNTYNNLPASTRSPIQHKIHKSTSATGKPSPIRHSGEPFYPFAYKDEELENDRKNNKHKINHPYNVKEPSPVYETQAPVLITQKPILFNNNKEEKIQNRVSSQKTVSIMPPSFSSSISNGNTYTGKINLNINAEETNTPGLFITPKPMTLSTGTAYRTKTKDSSTSKPIRLYPFRPRTQYNNNPISQTSLSIKSNNNNYSGSKNVPFITPPPALHSTIISQNKYHSRPNEEESLIVESIPAITIALKGSNTNTKSSLRPIYVGGNGNGNNYDTRGGIVDYLVPPKQPSSGPSNLFGTKQQNQYYNNKYTYDKLIENEMSKLKPPEIPSSLSPTSSISSLSSPPSSSSSSKKVNNSKKVNKDYSKYNLRNSQYQNSRRPAKQRNKYHNHKMSSPSSLQDGNADNERSQLPQHNNDHPYGAASHIDEQITSETGFLSSAAEPQSNGDRVEFQMHGQNGPKSYKFGYDTGKGHNRQFRYEERDKHGHVKGHYGYYDKDGKLQVVNYEADPESGFKANPVGATPDI